MLTDSKRFDLLEVVGDGIDSQAQVARSCQADVEAIPVKAS